MPKTLNGGLKPTLQKLKAYLWQLSKAKSGINITENCY